MTTSSLLRSYRNLIARLSRFSLLAYAVVFFTLYPTASSALVIEYESGNEWVTTGISTVGTYGDDMAGMVVTAHFENNTSESLIWTSQGNDSGGVIGSGWSLSVSGSTYWESITFGPWVLASSTADAITRLVIDAGTSNTVLDAKASYASDPINFPSTPGSQSGSPFAYSPVSEDVFDIVATYSDIVSLTGQDPVGDLYRSLSVSFGTNFSSGSSLSFSTDTDTLSGNISPVPEPGTLLLFGSGLLGIARLRAQRLRV